MRLKASQCEAQAQRGAATGRAALRRKPRSSAGPRSPGRRLRARTPMGGTALHKHERLRRSSGRRGRGGDEDGGAPMAERSSINQAFALRRPAIAADHVGRAIGLIEEDEAGRTHEALSYPPSPAVIGDVGAVLLGCPSATFFVRQAEAAKRRPDGRRQAHRPPHPAIWLRRGRGRKAQKRKRHERHWAEPLPVEPEKREPRHAPGRRRDGVTEDDAGQPDDDGKADQRLRRPLSGWPDFLYSDGVVHFILRLGPTRRRRRSAPWARSWP